MLDKGILLLFDSIDSASLGPAQDRFLLLGRVALPPLLHGLGQGLGAVLELLELVDELELLLVRLFQEEGVLALGDEILFLALVLALDLLATLLGGLGGLAVDHAAQLGLELVLHVLITLLLDQFAQLLHFVRLVVLQEAV